MTGPVALPESCRYLMGAVVDSAGVIRGKQVDRRRADVFGSVGLGASPSWGVFCIDDGIAFTPSFGVVGDMRLRADLAAVADLGDGLAWAPIDLITQDGEELPLCYRGAVRRQVAAAAGHGLAVQSAMEIECVLFDETGDAVAGSGGPSYGIRPLLEQSAFVEDVYESFERAGLEIEQLHAEYGPGQFELSLAPADPLRAADSNVLARILLCRAGRRHGITVSFSPQPIARAVGSGMHVHLSFARDGVPLLSGGDGPAGLTSEGAAIVAGLVDGLPEAIGVLAPSLLSHLRLQPQHWSGAFACWGVENREAAVRLCHATAGNPRGANAEVKPVDGSANPYVVQATLVGLALDGLERGRALPPAVDVDPASLDEATLNELGAVPIGRDQETGIDRLEASRRMTDILGAPLVEALVAVRRHELGLAKNDELDSLVRRFRFAWSS
ncbi:MAG TPA: glutamine synthetase family protein [Mycobacteriales bacterium]|nr:glutamine synthetase family protein [Mycobacteriales bacterium]